MSRVKIKIEFTDGNKYEVKVTPKVEVAVEKHYKKGLKSLNDDAHAEHLYHMAWIALNYSGMSPDHDTFDMFLDRLEDVEVISPDENEGEDFTKLGPSAPVSS